MPLRMRLTLLSVLLVAAALAGFSLAAYLISDDRIYADVDDALQARAGGVVSALAPLQASVTAEDIARSRDRLDEQATVGVVFVIRDTAGNILYASSAPVSEDLPEFSSATFEDVTVSTSGAPGPRLRVLYRPIVRGGEILGSVEVARSLRQSDDALRTIRNVFIFGGVVILVVTSLSSYLLSSRGLSPVRQLSRLARDIEQTADFGRRLRASGGGGEMRELVSTFNAMVERVERTLLSQQTFLADSSHELRRPLTVLRTNVAILQDPALAETERSACLQEMETEAETMGRLISDLLLLSRQEAQAIERLPVDLSRLCDDAVERLRTRDERHELVAEITSGLSLLGDRSRLAQMLWNLLDNAARYTPDNGRIELRLKRLDGVARVEIEDSGIGVSEKDLPHIFERFYRAESALTTRTEGSGLGLAIVKYIAEAHGGRVTVRSAVGRGSTFAVELPAID